MIPGTDATSQSASEPRSYTELEFRVRWGKPNLHYRDRHPIWHSQYGQVWHLKCPYCHLEDPSIGPDQSHHMMVKLDHGKFRCIRCNKSGTVEYLIKNDTPTAVNYTGTVTRPEAGLKEAVRGNKSRLGRTIQLMGLPRTHTAWRYLFDEGFTEAQILHLAESVGILYCEEGYQIGPNHFNTTSHRLVFMLKHEGKMEGWQARWLPHNYDNRKEEEQLAKQLKISKYLISPGFQKLQMPYNMDLAWKSKTIVAVEGVKKVWKTGPFALGTLGMQATLPENLQEPAFARNWYMRALADKKRLVILFDRSGLKSAFMLGMWYMKNGGEAHIVPLPENEPDDLDDYTSPRIHQILRENLPAEWLPDMLRKPL